MKDGLGKFSGMLLVMLEKGFVICGIADAAQDRFDEPSWIVGGCLRPPAHELLVNAVTGASAGQSLQHMRRRRGKLRCLLARPAAALGVERLKAILALISHGGTHPWVR